MLNLVTALQAEAKPLIEQLSLKKLAASTVYPIYASDSCRLIISGTGKCNSAAATAWLASHTLPTNRVWLNAGIAGHRDYKIGSIFCANRVVDFATGRNWYPVQITPPLPTEKLTTFDQPVTDYQANSLHDMEASGFMQTALRFSSAELVQCVKIVSDNLSHDIQNISESMVHRLISDQHSSLQQLFDHLVSLETEPQAVNLGKLIDLLNNRWRFSVTQQRQLERLLQRYHLIRGELVAIPAALQDVKNSTEVLNWFRSELRNVPLKLPS